MGMGMGIWKTFSRKSGEEKVGGVRVELLK